MNKKELSTKVKAKAYEFGYDMCGIIKADTLNEFITYLGERIDNYPESKDLFEDLYDLAYPQKKAEWARSIIVCIRTYSKYKIPSDISKYIGKYYLFDRRINYAKEYAADDMFETFLKASGMLIYKNGVSARWAAVKAGLGKFGNNNFVYTKFGSWIWIDTWLVDKEMVYNEKQEKISACPPNCRRCVDACPTKALSGPLMMDMGKCISHLSYFSTEVIDEKLREKMGTWMYGCDICQEVCPKNKNKWDATEDFPKLDEFIEVMKPENIITMDEITFENVVQPRFWYIEKDGLWIWKCNALYAMVNGGNNKYHQYIIDALKDKNEYVREVAAWACKKLGLYTLDADDTLVDDSQA